VSGGAPYRCGSQLAAEAFANVRRSMMLDHCKWDPQVGDTSTLADFPLVMARSAWKQLASWAESLTVEAVAAERELVLRPELHGDLGLPRRLREALRTATDEASLAHTARAFRYDFHLTRDGWRISECNADVPGGYTEASAFTALMAPHYAELAPAGDPGDAWVRAIARATRADDVALVSAAGFLEDAQVVHYLSRRLQQQGLRAHCLQPAQIDWHGEVPRFGARPLGAIVRFYQAEWLASLPSRSGWHHYLGHVAAPVFNPATCIAIESKRFPLVWDRLRSTGLTTWRELLPRSVDPREVPWRHDDAWLLKTALCNTGDTVSVRALMAPARWRRVERSARWFPGGWVAQRRFEPVPLETPIGPVFPCIGVYTIDGRACGAYARLSLGPIVDYAAVDVALLLEQDNAAQS
jgi:glutathionylspermidine synthase